MVNFFYKRGKVRKIQVIKNRFLGIVFLIFTLLISVFALTEFIGQNPHLARKLAGSILKESPKDSTNIIDEEQNNTNILSVNNPSQRKETQKDSITSW